MHFRTCVRAVAAIGLLLTAALVIGLQPGERASAGGTTMQVNPSSQTVSYDDGTVAIEVNIANAADMAAFGFRLDYNASILDFDSVTYGSFIRESGRSVQCQEPDEDAGQGYVSVGCASTGTTPPGVNGDGLLATMRFTLKAGGTTSIDFYNPVTSDALALRGSAEGISGSITVSGGPQPQATATRRASAATPTPFSGEILGTPIVGDGVSGSEPGFGNVGGGGTGHGGTISGNSSSGNSNNSSSGGNNANADGAPHAGDGSALERAPFYAGIAGLCAVLIVFGVGVGSFAGGRFMKKRRRDV